MTCSCTAGCQHCKRQNVVAISATLPTTFTASPAKKFVIIPPQLNSMLVEPASERLLNMAIRKHGYGVTRLIPTGRKLRRMKASDERRKAR